MKVKTSKGITLIALVITIIVLLILAGVSIAMLTGDNGILTKSTEAKQTNEQKTAEEQVKIAIMGSYGQDGKIDLGELKDNLNKIPGITQLTEDITEESFPIEVTVDGQKVEINKSENGTVTAEVKTGTTPSTPTDTRTVLEQATDAMPSGATIKEGTTEETGIVMIDSNENEWVWVEVPASVFETAKSGTDYTEIYTDLNKYTTDYKEGATGYRYNCTDEWYDYHGTTYDGKNEYSQIKYIQSSNNFSNARSYYGTIYTDKGVTKATSYTSGTTYYAKITEKITDKSGCGLTYEEYKTAYEKMLNSIYTNKGFYISRYEIGDKESTESNTTREVGTGTLKTPVSKADQIPYNYLNCSNAQKLASKMKTGEKTSSLLFGIQWDLVCKFLEEKTEFELSNIRSDSTDWGNYINSSLTLNRGKYLKQGSYYYTWIAFNTDMANYVTDSKTNSSTSYYQLLTTGSSEDTNVMNIYDFAGNVSEWTLERSIENVSPCSRRGGGFSNGGADKPASRRDSASTYYSGYEDAGLRVALY